MNYQVSIHQHSTIIAATDSGFRVLISERNLSAETKSMACCIVTLYRADRGFTQDRVYLFTVVNSLDQPVRNADLGALKSIVDFYLCNIIGTDLYVKEVPQESSLWPQESIRLFGEEATDEHALRGIVG